MNYGLRHRYYARSMGQYENIAAWWAQRQAANLATPTPPSVIKLPPPGSSGAPFPIMTPVTTIPNLPAGVVSSTSGPISAQSLVTPAPGAVAASGAAPAICLNQTQDTVPCSDPSCTYGDCGSGAAQVTVGSLCLDQGENQIACNDPNCTYGDCVASTSFFTKSTIISGVPDVAIYGLGFLLLAGMFGGGGYAAGRRR